jgi:hypothetical protein
MAVHFIDEEAACGILSYSYVTKYCTILFPPNNRWLFSVTEIPNLYGNRNSGATRFL